MDYSTDTRDRMADKGHAMGDGSFPIANRRDLANAITSFGRTAPEKKLAAKRHIKRRARELGATDLLPDSWA